MSISSSAWLRPLRSLLLVLLALQLGACTIMRQGPAQSPAAAREAERKDPLENINRVIFAFNTTADNIITKPIAKTYKTVVPEVYRMLIGNVFSNLNDVWVGVNNLLQGKPKAALSDWTRVVINSTVGLGGIADIATDLGLSPHNEDFGQTLGRWGMPPGPYLVLPILGPSNVRDGLSIVPDYLSDPLRRLKAGDRDRSRIVRLVDTRAYVFDAEKLIESAAIDRYDLVRDGYLSRRRSLIYDGDPPEEPALREENFSR